MNEKKTRKRVTTEQKYLLNALIEVGMTTHFSGSLLGLTTTSRVRARFEASTLAEQAQLKKMAPRQRLIKEAEIDAHVS